MNVLSNQTKRDIEALLRAGLKFREIERKLGVRRETVSKYARLAGFTSHENSKPANEEGVATGNDLQNRPATDPRPPDGGESKLSVSACEEHRDWILQQIQLGRNAMAIYQDLVEQHQFTHAYNSVKRFVGKLKKKDPVQFDILEFLPGEEAQVDYGMGARTIYPKTGKYRRPRLFVMTLKYSKRAFRKVVWNSSQEVWAKLHEEAFRYFGGCPQYVVLDNLKEGVLEPSIYEPELNPVYGQMLAHYGVVGDPARVRDPNRKGTVEKAIEHTQDTGLKGRSFESIEEQNAWLLHWEERWAAQRIHGRAKRQVEEMFQEEKKYLRPLPLRPFKYFSQGTRMVGNDGMIEVERAYYFVYPRLIGKRVPVRIYEMEIEILDPITQELVKRHYKSSRPGSFTIEESERIYNPSRESKRLLNQAHRIGPHTGTLADMYFEEEGRPAQRRIQGLVALARKYTQEEIEGACTEALKAGIRRLKLIKKLIDLKREGHPERPEPQLIQNDDLIRDSSVYGAFWEAHAQQEI